MIDKAGIWECERCGYRDGAPPYTGRRGQGAPQCRICDYPEPRNLERADRAAYAFGAEACANNLKIATYREDIAMYYGHRFWKDMGAALRERAARSFWRGYEREDSLR